MTLPQGRAGSLLALLLLVLLGSALWGAVVAPLRDWHDERAVDLETQHALLRRLRALAASLPALERAATAPDAAAVLALLDGSTDALAGANLQAMVQEMAAGGGVRIGSVETLAVEPRQGYRAIRLRLAATAGWTALVDLLAAIDRAAPRMLVDALAVRAVATLDRAAETQMEATFIVTAFRAADPSGARP